MRILLVEDDQKIALFIVKGLKAEGFAVDHAANGEDGLHLALTEPYDAAVIDIMLPKLDGLALIERMRQEKKKIPVIILSARDTVDDRVSTALGACFGTGEGRRQWPDRCRRKCEAHGKRGEAEASCNVRQESRHDTGSRLCPCLRIESIRQFHRLRNRKD